MTLNKAQDLVNVFNNAPCGLHSLDAEGVFITVNDTELKWLGYTREELIGKKKFTDLATDESRGKFRQLYPLFKKQGFVRDVEFEMVRKDGSILHVLVNSDAHYDEDGNFKNTFTYVTDNTFAKVEAVRTRAHHLLTTTIAENATVALFMMDDKGFCTFMNPAAEKMTGYSLKEMTQKPLHYMIHHSHPDGSPYPIEECPIDRALPENSDVRTHEDVFIRKDGTFFPVTCAASPIFENGRPIATVVEVRDLTEQRNAESLIKRKNKSLELLNSIGKYISENLDLQSILQKVTDATTQLSSAEFGAFFYNSINEKGEAFMLYTLSGAPLEAFSKFGMPRNTAVFHPTFSGQGVVRVADITKDPRYGKNDPHFGMPKGHLPVVSYLAVPVMGKDGSVLGGLFFGHSKADVFTQEAEDLVAGVASQAAIAIDNARLFGDLVKANEANQNLLALARELDSKKDEFIGIASHELKTPLTSIKAYIQLLERHFESEPESMAAKYTAKTNIYINRLNSLISDLLDVSKINAGKLEFNMSDFSFSELVHESIEGIQNTSSTHTILLEIAEDCVVHADRHRIEQVFSNLLTNAIKYSPNANKIDVMVTVNGSEAIVGVRDYGIGISKEQQEKVFERFYRVDNAHRFSGLGLGLFISYEIIKRHDGRMWVESEPDKGSTFYFSLPNVKQ